jgi:predicted nucleotidyltransferase
MGRKLILENLADDIKAIARRHGAANLRVFGSFARGVETSSSDLDLLVDFEPGRDLLDLVGLKQDLEKRLGIRVDVVTEQGMSPYLRSRILEEARPL